MLVRPQDVMCVEPNHVHVTGFSNGGMMAFGLAQSHLGGRIASIAPARRPLRLRRCAPTPSPATLA